MLKVIGNPLKSCLDLDFASGIDPRFNNQNRILSINSNFLIALLDQKRYGMLTDLKCSWQSYPG